MISITPNTLTKELEIISTSNAANASNAQIGGAGIGAKTMLRREHKAPYSFYNTLLKWNDLSFSCYS